MSNESSSTTTEPWFLYTTSDPSPSQPAGGGATVTIIDRGGEAPWKSFGTSMSAISFGFVATAILISMFLIMAIFEHLFRPNNPSSSFSAPHDDRDVSASRRRRSRHVYSGSDPDGCFHKLGHLQVPKASDYSVVMPGHHWPSHIAQPAPLPPCPREAICWPSHTD